MERNQKFDYNNLTGQNYFISIRDALLLKHPEPRVCSFSFCFALLWSSSSLWGCWGYWCSCSGCSLQGGAGPGDCDAAHWYEQMLYFATVLIVNIWGILMLLLPVTFVMLSCFGMMCVLCLPVDPLLLLNALGYGQLGLVKPCTELLGRLFVRLPGLILMMFVALINFLLVWR